MEALKLENEIDLKEDECCIVFDFSCYFPYKNFDILDFKISLGMEDLDDIKINHRYPNKHYQTISRKYGKKISKNGYPYVMKIAEQDLFLLCIKLGISGKDFQLVFPYITKMTKEKPICVLHFKYDFTENTFIFSTYERLELEKAWCPHRWISGNCDLDKVNYDNERDIILSVPAREDDNTVIYENVISPYPQELAEIII